MANYIYIHTYKPILFYFKFDTFRLLVYNISYQRE